MWYYNSVSGRIDKRGKIMRTRIKAKYKEIRIIEFCNLKVGGYFEHQGQTYVKVHDKSYATCGWVRGDNAKNENGKTTYVARSTAVKEIE